MTRAQRRGNSGMGVVWHPYVGWIPAQQWSGNYPGKDELSGNENKRSVVGAYYQRRGRDELSGYAAVGYRAPRHGSYMVPAPHHMSGYDIVGEAAKYAAQQMEVPAPAQYPGLPQFIPQWGQAPRETGEPRRLAMPFNSDVTINPGTLGSLIANPQEPLRAERLYLDADNGILSGLQVRGIFVGQQSQLVNGGVMPATMFGDRSVGGTLRGDTANPGIVVRVDIFNGTGAARILTGGLVGEALT